VESGLLVFIALFSATIFKEFTMNRLLLLGLAACVLVCSQAMADPIIQVGDHNLLANTPGQALTISVTGGDLVEGLNLYLQIDDENTGPKIQSIDVLTGTIFQGNNTGQTVQALNETGDLPYWMGYATVTTASGNVAANGLLATVIVDTTGFTSGTWSLNANFNYGGDPYQSDFGPMLATSLNGSITIVPEPGTLVLLVTAGLGLAACVWRRRGN
jgi:hypothetical protein